MAKLSARASVRDFQKLIGEIYSLPDDRLFSLHDLLSQQEKFTMRALKGIRKADATKLTLNLMIALSWVMAVANRLHIDAEGELWKRFPYRCSYCGNKTCMCKKIKSKARKRLLKVTEQSPKTLGDYQKMFETIYPASSRTIHAAGVHLAEEMGELSEAVHNFLGEHTKKRFAEIELELADYISCIFGVANSIKLNTAKELAKMYSNNCHSCHKTPCSCTFHTVAEYLS